MVDSGVYKDVKHDHCSGSGGAKYFWLLCCNVLLIVVSLVWLLLRTYRLLTWYFSVCICWTPDGRGRQSESDEQCCMSEIIIWNVLTPSTGWGESSNISEDELKFCSGYKLLWMWFEPCTSSEREAQLKAYEMNNIALLCGHATRKYMAAVRRLQLHWRCNKVICLRQVVNHYSHAVYARCCNQI